MVQDHTRRLRRAIERHAREHPLGEDYVMTTDADIITALARKLDTENTRLRAENEALREALPYMTLTSEEMGMPSLKYQEIKPTTPRTITADELREGQLICIHRGHSWGVRSIGTFVNMEGDVVTIKTGGSGTFSESTKFHTIVLLEDAPTSDDDDHRDARVTAETIRASEPGSTWEDRHGAAWEWTGGGMAYHSQFGDLGEESLTEYVVQQSGPFTRSTAAPRGDYSTTPRLTVHALNTAPVGSTVSTPTRAWTKHDDGTWFTVSAFGQHTRTSEELLALGYANATLTYPERGDHE